MEGKGDESVVVAIDKDKWSQFAIKWASEHLLTKNKSVTLVHVKLRQSLTPTPVGNAIPFSDINEDVGQKNDAQTREVFLPFRCFLSRKHIKCQEVLLEDVDISKALIDYAFLNAVEIMVLGATSKGGLMRKFKGPDVATNVTKGAPDFCTVYVIQKGKVLSVRNATRSPPKNSGRNAMPTQSFPNAVNFNDSPPTPPPPHSGFNSSRGTPSRLFEEMDVIRSPFTRGRAANGMSYGEISMPECDISFVSSGRPSVERSSIDRGSFDMMDFSQGARLSTGSDNSFGSSFSDRRSIDLNSLSDSNSNCSGFSMSSSLSMSGMQDDVEAEMRRLRLELKQTMDMYNAACKEALTAKQKALDLQKLKSEENQKIVEARSAEEAAMAIAEQEKAKCKAAIEAAEAAQRIAELEAQKRMNAEMKARQEAMEKKKAIDALTHNDVRYRRYSIEEIELATDYFSESLKIGEGGYGPVYQCTLDHTSVAIKVLRPDAAQGQSQFQQEVEILSCIRHPNMVLLLGACPEYGCLVYEYMSNGSLEDRLFCRGNTPPLPWQLRFRIAAEIATGLLFLHQSKPEPLVHRDLKPANILIDRNYVSKISDVGLARLVPPSMADSVTQYRMTQAAGTFCYIDPEYQQTGMLGTKSDIYSLGIMYLQLITAKPAMGLTHHVQRAIEKGTFKEMLDPSISDWPYEEALEFAQLSLTCAELRRKDRPDLPQMLPTLNRFRQFAEDNMPNFMFSPMLGFVPSRPSQISTTQDVISANPSRTSGVSMGSSG
ncbi:U-box domain-containing protein 52-like isoform X2 [Silene latifolia]|uniref:U-box domain-containing protein 52-like isoform X2 n=1 Tax=Silene latifolia TaxID=37657 RepID=UPI003D78A931